MKKHNTHTGATVDLKYGFDHLFFYSDVLASRPISDAQAPLLTILPNKSEEVAFGLVVTRRFQNIWCVKVILKVIFLTLLRSASECSIQFQSGRVFVELYFRPC